jgi:GR25 family glycosyltransferase involved in LPS biosynthesis
MVQQSNILDKIPIFLIYHQEERLTASLKNFRDSDFKPVYIKGFDGRLLFGKWPMPHKIGTIGCYLSFLSAFNAAKREKPEYVIIGEDDMYFVENAREKFEKMFTELPSDWEAVFLGKYNFEDAVVTRINSTIVEVDKFHGHHAVLYKYQTLLKVLEETERYIDDAFDLRIISMKEKIRIYAAEPHICEAKSNLVKDNTFKSTTDDENDEEYIFRLEIRNKIMKNE